MADLFERFAQTSLKCGLEFLIHGQSHLLKLLGVIILDCLEANRDSEMNVEEAALATEVLLAAYRSAARKEVVTLPLAR